MKSIVAKLTLLVVTCVITTGCVYESMDPAKIAGGTEKWQISRFPNIVGIGAWPTPEHKRYVAIDTVPLPE